jgi:hypothetical protein
MTKQIMISLLRQGETGDQILAILDSFSDQSDASAEPTLEEIEF